MKNLIALLAVVLLTGTSNAQDSVSVLFIGNSYTGVNALPSLVNDVTTSLGDILTFDSHTPGGQTFEMHANNATVYNKIGDNPWDFVVLQAQSQEPSFPDGQVNTNTLPYAIQLADSIYANNFCSEPLFYMTWGRENGDPQWAPISTFEGMNDRLRSAYMRFADSVQGAVSPVGSAWRYIRDTYPTIDLYTADGSHPSYEGSYLAACTFYASMFRKSPIGAPFIGGLDPITAERLQTAASMTVLDSLEQWNLRPISEHTQAVFTSAVSPNGLTVDFNNQSTKATNYIWDFGDGTATSTDENPTHTYGAAGNYTVVLIAESPCDTDTMTFVFNIVGLNEIQQEFELASFGNGRYELTAKSQLIEASVRNASGTIVHPKVELNDVSAKIDLSELASGVYFVSFVSEKGQSTVKLLK
ncbi:MAG: PKD domain-containing protein [Crocinitomicaceae bacterium]|nr:PKD domain-containing protein [Crocinitomicaceae bacterium]